MALRGVVPLFMTVFLQVKIGCDSEIGKCEVVEIHEKKSVDAIVYSHSL